MIQPIPASPLCGEEDCPVVTLPTLMVREAAPTVAHPDAWAIGFLVALVIGLAFVEWKTRPSTGKRSPSRFLKRYTVPILKWIGVACFAVLGWHLFFGGPL